MTQDVTSGIINARGRTGIGKDEDALVLIYRDGMIIYRTF